MVERHDALQALAEAAEKLTRACAAHATDPLPFCPPSPRSLGVSRALRKAYRPSRIIPAGMRSQIRKIK